LVRYKSFPVRTATSNPADVRSVYPQCFKHDFATIGPYISKRCNSRYRMMPGLSQRGTSAMSVSRFPMIIQLTFIISIDGDRHS
jgi:hypothetical protein